ncbi:MULTISPECIES: carbohydrate ABC transporter permease [unclassified Microbacterium]|uniref:carbohydrate ABC transporter permease n=1 Tax=Microbacterium TaxID=33882 RepID=UPI003B9F7F5C
MSTPTLTAEPTRTSRSKRAATGRRAQRAMFYGFLLPAIAITLIFTVYPLLQSIVLLFQQWQGYGTPRWVGWQNLEKIVTDTDLFLALGRTFWLTAAAAAGTVVIGTALAIAFYRKVPFANALKFLAFLPVILPPAVYALAWKNALDPTLGWVNPVLEAINPAFARNWLSDPSTAMGVVIFVSTIQYVGIPMILMLSALNDIPESVNEAATLDGVNSWQRIWLIILPLSRDVLVVVIGLQIIGNFKTLDTVYALTQGGPGLATDIIPTFVYREGFELSNFGYASTAAFFGTLIIVAATLIYTHFFRPQKMSNQ